MKYDIAIIGGGPAGYTAAERAAANGQPKERLQTGCKLFCLKRKLLAVFVSMRGVSLPKLCSIPPSCGII